MVKKETNTKIYKKQNQTNKTEIVEKKNKIQKFQKKNQDIRQAYQKILVHIKKRKQNPDKLNLAVQEALDLLKDKQNAQYNSQMGSKLIQIVLKYGNKDQKEIILLLLAKEDLFDICKSNYGSFIIEKVFRYSNKGKSFKLFKNFFQQNFQMLIANFEYLRALNSYLNFLDKKKQIELMKSQQKSLEKDEFTINEFVEQLKDKITLMHMSLTYYFLYFNYSKIKKENKQLLTTLLVENLEKALQQNSEVMIILALLNKLFRDMNLKHKKEILKNVLTKNFTNYLEYNSDFIYILLMIFQQLIDNKILNISVLKNIRLNYNKYFEQVQLAKFFLIILQKNIGQNIKKDKSFSKNEFQQEIIDLDTFENEDQFQENLKFFKNEILQENLIQPYFKIEVIKKNLAENSVFSLLYVAIFHHMILDDEYSLFVLQIFRELHHLIEYEIDFSKDTSEHFINSNNGSRFVKGIIQSIPSCSKLNLEMVEQFVSYFCEVVEKKPEAFVHCKSVFVLIAILENSQHKDTLKKILENSGQLEVNNQQKGFQLLKEIMNKQII